MPMLSKDSKLAYNIEEYDEPVMYKSNDASFTKVIEVTTAGWSPSTVDLWGECLTCEQTVRIENHSHSHDCELTETDACSWVDPDHIGDEIGNDLIPPETVGDWDFALYVVGDTGSSYGKRTHRVNGVIVESEPKVLPEVRAPKDLEELEAKFRCSYCKRTFQSGLYYSMLHTCADSAEAKAMLAISKRPPAEKRPMNPAIVTEAALTEHWFGADRNRVPSELGKLNWLKPVEDDAPKQKQDEINDHVMLIREYMDAYGETYGDAAMRLTRELIAYGK